MVRLLLAMSCAAFLGGCSMMAVSPDVAGVRLSRAALGDFSIEGRFSLRQDGKSYSGRLSWQHAGVNNDLVLSSPFGQGMAEIVTRAEGARLTTSNGQVHTAPDAELLTDQVLGYPLPLLQLTDWVRARVDATGLTILDVHARPVQARHAGWRIEYTYPDNDPDALPELVEIERDGGFELRLRIDAWGGQAITAPERGNP